MSGEVGLKVNFVVLNPVNPALVPNGAVFLDSTNGNMTTVKGTDGGVEQVGLVTSTNIFIKQMQASVPLTLNKPLSKRSDGKVQIVDSDASDGQQLVGFSLQTAANANDLINVLCIGANIVGALQNLGFIPGEEIFVAEDGTGFTNAPGSFTGSNDSIIKMGIADCAAGTASAVATDLLVFPEVIGRP